MYTSELVIADETHKNLNLTALGEIVVGDEKHPGICTRSGDTWRFGERQCQVFEGHSHPLKRGGNQFFGKIPGVFGYTANCLLSVDESYANTHLVMYKANGKWESRIVSADPASVLTMPYITAVGETLMEEGRAIHWGASTSNGIDVLIRDVGAEWVRTTLTGYEAVSAVIRLEPVNRSVGPAMVAVDFVWTPAKASCRFGMTPVQLDLMRITCSKQVSLVTEDQKTGTVTVKSTQTCVAAVVSVTCKVQPSVLSLKADRESSLTYSCPTRAGEVCVGAKCFNVGTDRFWINWGAHYAKSWSRYISGVANMRDTPFSGILSRLGGPSWATTLSWRGLHVPMI